jgi:hypothetical protein
MYRMSHKTSYSLQEAKEIMLIRRYIGFELNAMLRTLVPKEAKLYLIL